MNTPKNKYTSFTLLSEELLKRGYTSRNIDLSHKFVEFTAPNGWKWLTRRTLVSYPFMPLSARYISTNKQLSYEFAEHHNVTTPKGILLPDDEPKLADFASKYAPIVVKPNDGLGGHGMRLGITGIEAVREAIQEALSWAPNVLVQQQFLGEELRFTILDGEVVSVLLRETPRVIGDGSSTVAELIAAENDIRKDLGFEIVPYPQLDASIIPEHFLHDTRVPEKGEVVEFSKATLVARGGKMHDVTAEVHPSYIGTAERLGRALNQEFIVVDMLVRDYTQPQAGDNYVFLEFSTSPSLRLYYNVRSGNNYDMVSRLADKIDERSRKP